MEKCTAKASFQIEGRRQNMTLICSCLSKDVRREWPMRGVCTQCHCSATQRGCFIGIMSLPTAFPVLLQPGQPIKEVSRQSSAYFRVEIHISCFCPSPRASPAQRPSLPAVPGEAAGPQGSLGAPANGVEKGFCKTLGCCQNSLDKLQGRHEERDGAN